MELYKWQKECLAAWERNRYRGIASVVTGAGKTYLAIAAAENLLSIHPGMVIKIVVPTIELMRQWRSALENYAGFISGDEVIGLYYGKHKDFNCRITIYCIGSARYALARHISESLSGGHPVFLIADECHHYTSQENRRIFDFIPHMKDADGLYFSLGLSATPFGNANDSIIDFGLGKSIYSYDFQTAVKDRIISPFAIYQIAVKFTLDEAAAYDDLTLKLSHAYHSLIAEYPFLAASKGKKFINQLRQLADTAGGGTDDPAAAYLRLSVRRKEIAILAEERYGCVLSLIKALPRDMRILIYCERIAQAAQIHRLLRSIYSGSTGIYHSLMTSEARRRIMREFCSGRLRLLVSCRCLDEGIDVPDAAAGIILSGSSVPRQRIQRLGRILRKADQKDIAVLYYIYVKNSAEDHVYLPDMDEVPVMDITYDQDSGSFIHTDYETAAGELISRISLNGHQQKEFLKCIDEGALRGDYLLPGETLIEKQKSEADVHLKNYYLCMQRIKELYPFHHKTLK